MPRIDPGSQPPRTLLILGPTATGKSALAMALADHLPIEIVNGDSLQVYRSLDIGTAKPSRGERRRVPHHLIDILDPSEAFSAGEFRRRALPVIEDIRSRGRVPVVVGGSGFYLRTLVSGLSPIPAVPASLREELRDLLAREGLPAVRDRLQSLDPETASRVAEDDTQRTLRALEVVLATGRGLADWWRAEPTDAGLEILAKIGLTLPRALLYHRISQRLEKMVADGWVDEVQGLLAGGCLPEMPAFQAIGYRQVVRHIKGEWPLERSLEDAARETRRFAKRQLTWFRREPEVAWIESNSLAKALQLALKAISRRTGE